MEYLGARWILPIKGSPIEHGIIAFEAGKITAVGPASDFPQSVQNFTQTPQSQQRLITPGFINTHTHLELSFDNAIPLCPGQDMADWLLGVVDQTRQAASLPEQAKRHRCQAGLQQLAQSGVTCVNDIASDPTSLTVLAEEGFRGIVSLEFFHPGFETLSLTSMVERYEALTQANPAPQRIQVGLSPHSPYNVSPRAWQWAVEACQPPLIHSHAAETQAELDWIEGKPSPLQRVHQTLLGQVFSPQVTGLSPIEYLEHFNLLTPSLIIAHGVWTSPNDRKCLSDHGVSLAHCPQSNLFLQQKTLCWRDWQEAGIPVGLGTDSRLSTHCLDIRHEARLAVEHHRWTPPQALQTLTLEGAKALKMEQSIGSLCPGKAADLVCWHSDFPLDSHKPEAEVLSPQTSVEALFVNGTKLK